MVSLVAHCQKSQCHCPSAATNFARRRTKGSIASHRLAASFDNGIMGTPATKISFAQTPVQRVNEVKVFEEWQTRFFKKTYLIFPPSHGCFPMPVFTRNMRKTAGLPNLPDTFSMNVPKIYKAPAQAKQGPAAVPRSSLPIASPSVLSFPGRFDSPSPLTSFADTDSSQRSRSHSYSSSTLTEYGDDGPFSALHPGIRKLQRKPDERWMFIDDGTTMRMCMLPIAEGPNRPVPPRHHKHRGPSMFGREWEGLSSGPTSTYTAASRAPASSSDATVRGTPSRESTAFAERNDKETRVLRRQPRRGTSGQ
ncbi:hypothetical protein C8R43DRAFT_475816 [Mycena crocata]|nr:hypothetical protein C8R43DRAFT_475816 [Mycena crocata]